MMAFSLVACGSQDSGKEKVVIYSSAEDFRLEHFQKRLNEQFPDYEIVIEYMATGTHAAKLLAEGTSTECDIVYDLEYGYMEKLSDIFADLSDYDLSIFEDDLIDSEHKYIPEVRNGGCIAVNVDIMEAKGLAMPEKYEDLLKPEYQGLISMPNPKSSGTGYMFLKNLVNVWGEDKAFEYFDQLAPNILQFTSSGSGPVNALRQGEAAIGLAMTAQTVQEINNGANFEILFFEEGSPYSCYGMAMIEGKQTRPAVKEVFDFFYDTLVIEDKELFYPEKIFKDMDFEIENYPTEIEYANMSNTQEEKERLLEKWKY